MNEHVAGSCVGFGVRSDLAFDTLRAGDGRPLLVEQYSGPPPRGEEIVRWLPRDGHPFHGRLLRLAAGYAFWASDAGWFVIDPSIPSIAMDGAVAGDPSVPLIRELRLFGVPTSICAIEQGDVALHASGVEIGGEAVLFAGPTMYGKTTLAAALSARGHRLLCEDTARCALAPEPAVFPGPAVVRLRADVAARLHVPNATGRRMPDGRVPLIYDIERRGTGAPVRLRAIVLLRPGPDVQLSVVPGHQAARDLFAITFRLPLAEQRSAAFARVVDIVAKVPVLDLRRPLTLESIDEVAREIEGLLART
jgi:hypothetical protein